MQNYVIIKFLWTFPYYLINFANNFEAKFNFPLRSVTPSNSQSHTILLLFISSELLLLLQSLPLNWQILIFLPKFPLTLIPLFIAQLMTILELIWMVFMIIWEIFHGNLSSNLVLLLLHVSGTRLKLMHISLTVICYTSCISMVSSSLCCCYSA